MAASYEGKIPEELVEEWYSIRMTLTVPSFRKACAEASMATLESAIQPFFVVWKTSLMSSDDFEKLRRVSLDDHLCSLVETILIADDCEEVDPWALSVLPSPDLSWKIWPRNNAGIVLTSEIGVADLKTLLRQSRLRPKKIKIRYYQINRQNLKISPEMGRIADLVKDIAPATTEPIPVAAFAKEVIDGADLAVTCITIRHANSEPGEHTFMRDLQFPNSTISNPTIKEAVIEISREHQGEGQAIGFPMLHTADLELGSEGSRYWLEQVLYNAPALKTLRLHKPDSSHGFWIMEGPIVVPKLTTFALSWTHTSAEAIIAMLASSKDSLTNISFQQVTLDKEGPTWRELLLRIAKEYQALTSFTLRILRDKTDNNLAIDFRKAKEAHFPEECRQGLNLTKMGPPENKRVTRLSYDGPKAGQVLEILSGLIQAGTPHKYKGLTSQEMDGTKTVTYS